MTKRSHFLGIDLGTSAVKAAVFDSQLRERAAYEVAIETFERADGTAEQDFSRVVAACIEALTGCISRLDRNAATRIECAGIATHRSSMIAYDAAKRRFVSPLVLWKDRRAADFVDRLGKRQSDAVKRLRRRTGLPLLPYFFAPRVAAWRASHRDRRSLSYLTADAALLLALGDEDKASAITDPSMFSRTLLANRDGRLDPVACKLFGIDPTALARVLPSAGLRGVLANGRLPRALRGVPVTASLADQSASYLGLAAIGSGRIDRATTLTIGTGLFAVRGGASGDLDRGVFPLVLHSTARSTVRGAEANDPSTGSAFTAFTRLFDLPTEGPKFDALARTSRSPIAIVPSVQGLGAPWLAPAARGALFDLASTATHADIARGLVDGVAARAAELLALLGGRSTVLTGGGGARSDFLLQRIADRSGRTLVRVGIDAAGARGAAWLAATELGVRPLGAASQRGKTFHPRTTVAERARSARSFAALARFVAARSRGQITAR